MIPNLLYSAPSNLVFAGSVCMLMFYLGNWGEELLLLLALALLTFGGVWRLIRVVLYIMRSK